MTDAESTDPAAVRLEQAIAQATQVDQQLRTAIGDATPRLGLIEADLKRLADSVQSSMAAVQDRLAAMEAASKAAGALLTQIEEANRKANSEAGYAYNAKGSAEEHAKAIAQIRGITEVDAAAVAASKTAADALTQALTQARSKADEHVQHLAQVHETAGRSAESVSAAAVRVAAALPAIDKGTNDANAISAAKAGADAGLAAIQSTQNQLGEILGKASADATVINKNSEESSRLVGEMGAAKKRVDTMTATLADYEQGVQKSRADLDALREKIEALLPGATSAGLASAFHAQKERFRWPQWVWLALFVCGILALIAAAATGLPATAESWEPILRHIINRLPLVAPLVWLSIYAGHHYNMALRMQEEYAFKEAVSRAFEGYKREMEAIDCASDGGEKPLVTLCENVLSALAERPGRIYEGKTDVATPLTPLANILKELVAAIKKRENSIAN